MFRLESACDSDDVFDRFSDANFTAICYGALQYDIGTANEPSPHLIEALRATKLLKPQYTQRTGEFTPLKDEYVTAGASYKITDFDPHNEACSTDHTCPDCP